MPLQPGTRLGSYEIVGAIGAGGMGEVYQARDTALNRDVAIKVMPDSFAGDPDRLARFQREAEALAALNHPNIATIYGVVPPSGVGDQGDGAASSAGDPRPLQAIVMELVEGPTLADIIAGGHPEAESVRSTLRDSASSAGRGGGAPRGLKIEDALPIARQIAEALEAAHEAGIIHRDLKPANIKVKDDGTVKVLDFGLAKAVAPEAASAEADDAANSPTLTARATQMGMILGTAAYMAPEQAKGKPVDKRADVWAFGVVLFEMLTGQRPFDGSDVSEVMAGVIKSNPDWELLPSDLPAAIRRLLRRALVKEKKDRLPDIAAARLEIADVEAGVADGQMADATEPVVVAPPPTTWQRLRPWLAVVVPVAAVSVLATWVSKPTPTIAESRVIRTTITADELQQLPAPPVLSPDGRILVYGVANSLWIRYLDQFEPRAIPDSEDAGYPFFSPDSQFLGYGQGGKLWKVDLENNNAKSPVCDCIFDGATWGTDGTIVFGQFGGGLSEVSEQGGDPRRLEAGRNAVYPHFLPDRQGIIVSSGDQSFISLWANGQRTRLHEPQAGAAFLHPVYSPSGHLIYRRNGSNPGLYAVPFSLSSLEISGEPFIIDLDGDWPSVSDDHTLSYWTGAVGGQNELVRVDRTGQALGTIGKRQWNMLLPALSSGGNRVAVSGMDEGRDRAIWVHDQRGGGSSSRLSRPEANGRAPVWTGDQVAFVIEVEGRREIWMRPADGSSAAKKLTNGSSPHFSLDGRYLVFVRQVEGTSDLWYLEVGQEGDPKEFLTTPENESAPRLSPDSRWVAYTSEEPGQPTQVYVKRFPSGEGRVQVSTDRGHSPRWSPDGDELFYLDAGNLMVVAVTEARDGSFVKGTPAGLFESGTPQRRAYAVAEGGESFILPRTASSDIPTSIAIVHNWFLRMPR